jgi:homoprotocatechuate degradation regulator HpaR
MPSKEFSQSHLPPTQRSLPMALLRARENVMAPIRAMLSASGLTEQQWRLLRVLSESGPLEATILANRAALLLPSQTRIVQSMEKRGLVFRRPHNIDKRRHTVEITALGQAIIDDNQAQAKVIADSFSHALGAEKFDTLLDLLRLLETADLSPNLNSRQSNT